MPLTKAVRRKLQHRRTVVCDGYEREDGLWDIEGRMTDVKTDTVDNPERGGFVPAGEPFHDIWLRLTLDRTLKIHQAEAAIEASPFRICPGITGQYRKLEGTRIGPGWHRQANDLLGGTRGCTHLNELLKPLATTAIQALWPSTDEEVMKLGANVMLNTCHTWGQGSQVIKQYLPDLYQAEGSDS
ncbi:DUF2889 domain-containing protein [Nitrincola alkalilacustris]|uniref:DUF2889 domain-containing protein n=1 Tax=Nitrincola alkalilacustris TaxID=1571224 RepID=UPI00124D2CCB|nr:DUF2889 domain-containing protein [Nitrincola alkalilacustris]